MSLQDPKAQFLQAIELARLSAPTRLLALAVATFETGNFRTDLFKIHRNPFGMRPPRTRNNHTGQTSTNFAIFPTYAAAILDFVQRLGQFNQIPPVNWQNDRGYIERFVRSYLGTDASERNVKAYADYLQAYGRGQNPVPPAPDEPPGWFVVAVFTALFFVAMSIYNFARK